MVTWIASVIIGVFFLFFCIQLIGLFKVNGKIGKYGKGDAVISSLMQDEHLKSNVDLYLKSINIPTSNGNKTNTPSSFYLNLESISCAYRINFRMLDAASGILVGLGLLGTFLGLTLGIEGINVDDSEKIKQSINDLLDGMETAFITSLLGMFLSIIYTICDKNLRKGLQRNLYLLTERLDVLNYIDDNSLQVQNQSALVDRVIEAVRAELNSKLAYSNDAGESVTIGNAVREILVENTEQSKALKSFSTDLALELNNGFDEVLSRQMQEKILPLMESVDATTRAVVEHIDQMASTVSSPASDMMASVVDELKKSMKNLIDEFSSNLSGSATSQLETLAIQLGTASQSMGDFPKCMENVSNTLQVTIDEVKSAIAEISKTSANANSTAMQQMQEQIAFATGSISSAIAEVKDVMNGITNSSQEQNSQMIAKLTDATDKMGEFLNTTIAGISSSVQNSMKSISDDVAGKQADLIALQEDTTSQTRKLLETFNAGLDRLEKLNDSVIDTMNGFKLAQGEISVSTGNLRSISGDVKLATELFNKGQNDYVEKLNQLQQSSQRGIEQVNDMLRNSGEMTDEYARKFEIIKQGLSGIFEQLQKGLTEYSKTVQATTQKYLDQYSSSLTQTTDALASTIQSQNEVVEMLNETLSHRR